MLCLPHKFLWLFFCLCSGRHPSSLLAHTLLTLVYWFYGFSYRKQGDINAFCVCFHAKWRRVFYLPRVQSLPMLPSSKAKQRSVQKFWKSVPKYLLLLHFIIKRILTQPPNVYVQHPNLPYLNPQVTSVFSCVISHLQNKIDQTRRRLRGKLFKGKQIRFAFRSFPCTQVKTIIENVNKMELF